MEGADWIILTLILFTLGTLITLIAIDHKRNSLEPFSNDSIPNDSLYIIYSISNSPYQEWQADLLDYSINKVKQPGTIIRIVSDDPKYPGRKLPKSKYGHTIGTEDYSKYAGNYSAMNKPGGLKALFKDWNFPKNSVAILPDPDMIFTKPWDPRNRVTNGKMYGQKWKGYSQNYCKDTTQFKENCPPVDDKTIMYPFAISVEDLKRITPKYYESSTNYKKKPNWMTEMTALVVAMHDPAIKLDIQTAENIGLCNNWDNSNDLDAPIMHYCQTVKDNNGKTIWGKREYKAWDPVPEPSLAQNRVDREVLGMIKSYIKDSS